VCVCVCVSACVCVRAIHALPASDPSLQLPAGPPVPAIRNQPARALPSADPPCAMLLTFMPLPRGVAGPNPGLWVGGGRSEGRDIHGNAQARPGPAQLKPDRFGPVRLGPWRRACRQPIFGGWWWWGGDGDGRTLPQEHWFV
jgi:hypothetical protein